MASSLVVIMNSIESINYQKDSTLAMLWEAKSRGWSIYYILPEALYLDRKDSDKQAAEGKGDVLNSYHASGVAQGSQVSVLGSAQRLVVSRDAKSWFKLSDPEIINLAEFDLVLVRNDPPFNMAYIYMTYFLDLVAQAGVLVLNNPSSVRTANEKLFAYNFPQCMPPTCVSTLFSPIQAFYEKQKDIILKPLDGMGGAGIFRIQPADQNLKVAYELLSKNGVEPIMAQKYIPDIVKGDKRILLIDGEPVPYALARVPPENELRGNLAAGGKGIGCPLTERDYWICEQVGPKLKEMGLLFVGLDVIGDYLTEINVTSPTCIRELDQIYSLNIASQLFDSIEERVN